MLCSELAELAQILDPRFGSEILSHSTILRSYVVVPSLTEGEAVTEKSSNELQPADCASFMRRLLNDDSLQDCYEDKVVAYLPATAIADKSTDPFEWWKANAKRYPNIALLARDMLAIQASSVCSEDVFSVAGNLLDPLRKKLFDESRSSVMVLRA